MLEYIELCCLIRSCFLLPSVRRAVKRQLNSFSISTIRLPESSTLQILLLLNYDNQGIALSTSYLVLPMTLEAGTADHPPPHHSSQCTYESGSQIRSIPCMCISRFLIPDLFRKSRESEGMSCSDLVVGCQHL